MTEREGAIAVAIRKWFEGYVTMEEAFNDIVTRFTEQELKDANEGRE